MSSGTARSSDAVRDLAGGGRIELVDDFADWGIVAFTTTRTAGSYGLGTEEPVRTVMARWDELRRALAPSGRRLASAHQVHGIRILEHTGGWSGWLRGDGADGHATLERGTGMAVTIADCVPIFLGHPSGAIALLHSGWRGTAGSIVRQAIGWFEQKWLPAKELRIHLGPGICGDCYEVSADVYAQVTGRSATGPTLVDLRTVIAQHARDAGVREIAISPWCTRHHNDRFFSHRAGDLGRQLGVMIAAE